MNNPLLELDLLPEFSKIKADHIEPALDILLAENREKIKELLQLKKITYENFVQAMEDLDVKLTRMWSVASHLNNVENTDEIRDAYNKCIPKLTLYSTELAQNKSIFEKFYAVSESEEFNSLNQAQKKVIEKALRDFKLAGVDLSDDKKQRFKEIQQQLAKLSTKYEENIIDATDSFEKHITDESRLKGIPKHYLTQFKSAANEKNLDGYLINLEFPNYYAVIMYADDRELRKAFYTAYSTKASDQGPSANQFDNSAIMEDLLKLRHEEACLVGFNNYAEYSLATKMANTSDEVLDFLWSLADKSKAQGEKEVEELKDFANYHHKIKDMQAWDITYLSEKLRIYKYNLSQDELRPYFPLDSVLNGLFSIVEKIYDINIVEKIYDVNTWHDSVRYFEIFDTHKQQFAGFYIDLFARPKKRGGAWMDANSDGHSFATKQLQLPIAFLTCNFNSPSENEPALLTHNEVLTLFHEFGHGLHHMLTHIDIASVSGINGVAWDAVEFPSQFMEHYCWQKKALDLFACHYQTKAPIPDELFEKMIQAKNFQSAMQMLRQLEFSIFDFRLHCEYKPEKGGRIQEILNEVREKVSVIKAPEFNRFQHSFSHIFAGGYAAGYYSYKWAEVLACDAFSVFEANGIFDKTTGKRFLESILQQGGSKEPMELFISFQGREPKVDALLKYSGIL